jgi:hypothetical protein
METTPELEALEDKLLKAEAVSLHGVKTSRYNEYAFEGVYIIFHGEKMLKVGKTSGKTGMPKVENALADRLWGLTEKNEALHRQLGREFPVETECRARCVKVEDALLRGRLEFHLMAKYAPVANHAELEK